MADRKKAGGSPLPREVWQTFLESYEQTGCVRSACDASGASVRSVYRWMSKDENKREAFDEVRESQILQAESTLFRLAISGKDTTALIFFLKSRKPDVYNRAPQPAPIAVGDEQRPQVTIEIIEPADARHELMRRLNEQRDRLASMEAG